MNLLKLLYLHVEVVGVGLHLLHGSLSVQIVVFQVFLPDLIELGLKIVTFLLVAFKFNLKLEAALVSLSDQGLALGDLFLHLLRFIGL